ncbi:MAG: hypothetical protein IT355_10815 [Gemmatimonadaceae bacterium]|nr:hypothetical protein [Gemmatimonadaceae bacterium]
MSIVASQSPFPSAPVSSSFGNPSSRRQLAEMKQTLAVARLARDDVRKACATSRERLAAARTELATILRRSDLARQIDDTETVAVAERFAETQRSTVSLLERKLGVQEEELSLAEQTVSAMEAELRGVTGIGPAPSAPGSEAPGAPAPDRADASEYRGLDDAARAQAADERLAELKRKMGR